MAFQQRYNEESAALGCRATNSYHQELHKLGNIELLIIDYSGLKPLNPAKRHDMMELLYRRYGLPVKVIISNCRSISGMSKSATPLWSMRIWTVWCTMTIEFNSMAKPCANS